MLHFEGKKHTLLFNILKYVVVLALVVLLFCFAADAIAANTADEQRSYLEDAVRRKAVYCYSVEGEYPQNVEYIEKHYGLLNCNNKLDTLH